MASSFYTLTITNGGTGIAPGDGFIDNTSFQDYLSELSFKTTGKLYPDIIDPATGGGAFPPSGLTVAATTAKRRGNLRYNRLIATLQYSTNIYLDQRSIVKTSAAWNLPASAFVATLWVEHGESSLITPDELNPGVLLTGVPALIRMASRSLTYETASINTDIYDPTPLATIGNALGVSVPRFGVRIGNIAIGPVVTDLTIADSLVTIVPIDVFY